jgi:hypothetical protein
MVSEDSIAEQKVRSRQKHTFEISDMSIMRQCDPVVIGEVK